MQAAITQVLITGAGPAGLMMACQLIKQRIRFRIIDKNGKSAGYSGALLVHAGTLEILKQLGIAEELIHRGKILKAINFMFNGRTTVRLETGRWGSRVSEYPYALLVEQPETETLLAGFIEKNGQHIERGVELTDFTEYSDHVESVILYDNKKEETVLSDYLVAADGGNSFIRSKLEIPLVGRTHKRSLFAADCESDLDLPHDEALIAFSPNATTGFFPLGSGLWRIDGAFRWHMNGREIRFEDIDSGFSGITRVDTGISNARWFSTFHSHRRNAASFNTDRCFLIGDAAHLYSPVGSQGMNHGMQDAFNLAWKMSFVIRKHAKPCLLDTYDSERKDVARKTARISDLLFDFLSTDRPFYRMVRNFIMPVTLRFFKPLFKKQLIKRYLFKKISGVGITYMRSSVTFRPESPDAGGPSAGERLPSVLFSYNGKSYNIADLIQCDKLHLLIFSGENSSRENSADFARVLNTFSRQVTANNFSIQPGTNELYRIFGVQGTTFYVVRPDYYIACKGHTVQYLEKYLYSILIPAR